MMVRLHTSSLLFKRLRGPSNVSVVTARHEKHCGTTSR